MNIAKSVNLRLRVFLFILFIFLSQPPLAYAMHIAEGMLGLRWSIFWWLLAGPFMLMGLYHIQKLKRLNPFYLPLVSTLAAAVFIFSMLPLPVPITGTTSHPIATGLSGLMLGVLSTAVVSFISLFIQAIFLGHGGITTLGANLFSMGIVGPAVALFIFYFLKKIKISLGIRAFSAGFLADICTYLVTSYQLALMLSTTGKLTALFLKFILIFTPIQLPIAILEGILTAAILRYIHIHKPEIIKHLL